MTTKLSRYAAALREAETVHPEDLDAAAEFYDRLAAGTAYEEQVGFLTADGYVMVAPEDIHPEITTLYPDEPTGATRFEIAWGYAVNPFTGTREYGWRMHGWWRPYGDETAAWRLSAAGDARVYTSRQIEDWIAWAYTTPSMARTPIEWIPKGGASTRTY